MVELYLPAFSRFPLRKPEYIFWFPQESNSRLPHYSSSSSRCTWLPTKPLRSGGVNMYIWWKLQSTRLTYPWTIISMYDGIRHAILDAAAELGRNSVSKHQIQPECGDEQVDAGRDSRKRLARPNSQARTWTGKYSFSLFSWQRAGLATLRGWTILLLYVWPYTDIRCTMPNKKIVLLRAKKSCQFEIHSAVCCTRVCNGTSALWLEINDVASCYEKCYN